MGEYFLTSCVDNFSERWGRGWDEGRIPWDNVASFPWAAAGGTRSTPGRSLSYASRMLQIQEYNPAAICYLQELVIIQSVSAPSSPSQFTWAAEAGVVVKSGIERVMLIPVRGGRHLLVCNHRSVFNTHWSVTFCERLNNFFQQIAYSRGEESEHFVGRLLNIFPNPHAFFDSAHSRLQANKAENRRGLGTRKMWPQRRTNWLARCLDKDFL